MTVKEWLERGFKLNLEIQQLKDAKERAKSMADTLQNKAELKSYREYSVTLFKRIDQLLEINKEVVEAIATLDDIALRSLLTARYINFKTWESIADDLEVDLRWVYRLHRRALDRLEEKMIIKNQ